jgi:flagellar M-ring protein FliF
VPGADSNVPSYSGQQGGSTNQAQRTEKSTSYELSKTIEKVVRAPGGVKRISVAAAVDSAIVGDADQFDAISRLIATAAGLDVNRGDKVTLTSLPFAAPAEPEKVSPVESARTAEMVLQGGRFAAMIIGPLIVLFLIRQILKDKPTSREPALLPLVAAGERPSGDPQRPTIQPIRDIRNLPHTHIQEEVQSFARSEPAAVAQIVRTWLREDQAVR